MANISTFFTLMHDNDGDNDKNDDDDCDDDVDDENFDMSGAITATGEFLLNNG